MTGIRECERDGFFGTITSEGRVFCRRCGLEMVKVVDGDLCGFVHPEEKK